MTSERRILGVDELSIAELKTAYESGKLTAERVVLAHLRRINRYEENYNAFTYLNARALEAARSIDARRAQGEALEPLAGVPIILKESIDLVGFPSTAGWLRTSGVAGGVDLFPRRSAPVAQRLIDAGAIVIGKGNIPPFSDHDASANWSWAGPTYNAIDRALAPGASSSGVATAVAGNFVVVGVGEETGGSIQNPAAAQSLVGVKTTFGLVPNTAVVPLGGSTRDVLGPIARTVEDAAIMLDAIAGPSPDDPKTAAAIGRIPDGGYAAALRAAPLEEVRLGTYGSGWRAESDSGGQLSAESHDLYQGALAELRALHFELVQDPFRGSGFSALANRDNPFDYDYRGTESVGHDFYNYIGNLGFHSVEDYRAAVGVTPFDPGEPLSWYVEESAGLAASLVAPSAAPDLSEFNELREEYLRIFNEVMDSNDLDALVFPQSHNSLPSRESDAFYSATTVSEINIAGLPAVVVPAGQYADHSPFALIFVGRQWSEALLLKLAYEYEQSTHHRIVPNLESLEPSPLFDACHPFRDHSFSLGPERELGISIRDRSDTHRERPCD